LDPVRRALADRLRGLISGTGKAGHLLTSAVQIQREQGLTQIFRLSAEERDGRLRSLDGIFDTAKPVERELKSPGGRLAALTDLLSHRVRVEPDHLEAFSRQLRAVNGTDRELFDRVRDLVRVPSTRLKTLNQQAGCRARVDPHVPEQGRVLDQGVQKILLLVRSELSPTGDHIERLSGVLREPGPHEG